MQFRTIRSIRSRFLSLACTIALFATALAQAAPDELVKLRGVYVSELQKAQQTFVDDLGSAPDKYIADLLALEQGFQRAGDLKPLLAVRDEREHFAKDQSAASIRLVEVPQQLRTMQEAYLASYNGIAVANAQNIVTLSQKYVRSLTALQKELTQKGRIDDALAVLAEVEQVKGSAAVSQARQRLSGAGDIPVTLPGQVESVALDQVVHGTVISWNSVTGEIKCQYDFSKKEHFMDWENSSIDEFRERLVCENKPATLLPAFKSIRQIEYQAYLYSGENGMRMSLSDALTAEIGAGPEHNRVILYQDNPHFPMVSFEREIKEYIKYDSVLTLNDNHVTWSINGKEIATVELQRPLPALLQCRFGRDGNHTLYDNVTLTGTLNTNAAK